MELPFDVINIITQFISDDKGVVSFLSCCKEWLKWGLQNHVIKTPLYFPISWRHKAIILRNSDFSLLKHCKTLYDFRTIEQVNYWNLPTNIKKIIMYINSSDLPFPELIKIPPSVKSLNVIKIYAEKQGKLLGINDGHSSPNVCDLMIHSIMLSKLKIKGFHTEIQGTIIKSMNTDKPIISRNSTIIKILCPSYSQLRFLNYETLIDLTIDHYRLRTNSFYFGRSLPVLKRLTIKDDASGLSSITDLSNIPALEQIFLNVRKINPLLDHMIV